ncbi:MAG TPA: c-type cytochrome domain-containing protein [Bdellovibrionales bacterium]|nr:c-type cytochrome domain-containing protein [Bdellovibrionales bacterium]
MRLRNTVKLVVGLVAFGLFVGCSGDDGYSSSSDGNETSNDVGNNTGSGDSGENEINTYGEIQSQIFNAKCVACHSGESPSGALDLTSHSDVVADITVVSPGNPQGSSLFVMVQSGDMPPGPEDLSEDEIDAIEDWIEAGAPNGQFDAAISSR